MRDSSHEHSQAIREAVRTLASGKKVNLDSLSSLGLDSIDLTSSTQLDQVKAFADDILAEFEGTQASSRFERQLISHPERDAIPLQVLVAAKLAKSKSYINQLQDPLLISVCFAVYSETERLKTREGSPHGEDFFRRKVEQLDWLVDRNPLINWELVVCDDGCPDRSGHAIRQLVDKCGLQSRVRVVFLQDAIDSGAPTARLLTSTDESRKGGSIQYAMYVAAQGQGKPRDSHERHIIVYTDADLSTHLGQVGLLAEPLLAGDKTLVLATRASPEAVQIRGVTRKARGNLLTYLKKALVKLPDLQDPQCGFKGSGLIECRGWWTV